MSGKSDVTAILFGGPHDGRKIDAFPAGPPPQCFYADPTATNRDPITLGEYRIRIIDGRPSRDETGRYHYDWQEWNASS